MSVIETGSNPNMSDMMERSAHFMCVISKGNQSMITNFSVGSGIVDQFYFDQLPAQAKKDQNLQRMTVHIKNCLDDARKNGVRRGTFGPYRPKFEPSIVDILDCLASDASCTDQSTFEDFASDLGYDSDSRKALATFETIERQSKELRLMLGREAFETLLYEIERQ